MNRRRFLAATSAALPTGLAGCSIGRDAPIVPDGMSVATRHEVADVLEDGLWSRRAEREDPPAYYHATIADRATALDRIEGGGDVAAFVRGTDFDRSIVVIVQNVMQSARWLELWKIERTDAGLRILASSESPEGPYGDDAAVHSLAIRVTGARRGALPSEDEVVVGVEGYSFEDGVTD